MFINLLMIIMIVAPLPAIYVAISKRTKPYVAIGYGIGFGTICLLLVFTIAYLMGESFGDQIDKGINAAVNGIIQNKEALEKVGLDKLSDAKAISVLTDMYKAVAMVLPSSFVIVMAVISYIEYNATVKFRFRQSRQAKPYAYLRNFKMTNNDVIGWFIIFVISYLMKLGGISIGEIAVMNINIMVNGIISVQAMGLIFFVTYMKQRPRIIPVLISVGLWIVPMGQSILFILGLLDLLLNLRGKIDDNIEN